MNTPNFQPSQLVALKSGGPAMTVIRPTQEAILCCWTDTVGQYQEQIIDPIVLKSLDDDEAYQNSRKLQALQQELQAIQLKAQANQGKAMKMGLTSPRRTGGR